MCGIIGVVAKTPVNQLLYDGLLVLQHRGQDAAGIVTAEGTTFHMHKGAGLVRDVFRTRDMRSLPATSASRTAVTRRPGRRRAARGAAVLRQLAVRHRARPQRQPDQLRAAQAAICSAGPAARQHQLRLRGAAQRARARARARRERATARSGDDLQRRRRRAPALRGAYAVVAMIAGYGLLAFRDPYGIRPLVFGSHRNRARARIAGRLGERRARFARLRGRARRRAGRGDPHRRGRQLLQPPVRAEAVAESPCIFEYVYLARPDSVIDGISVYETRLRMGESSPSKIKPRVPPPRHRRRDPDPRLQPAGGAELAERLGVATARASSRTATSAARSSCRDRRSAGNRCGRS